MTYINKAEYQGIIISNNAYKNMADCTFNAYSNWRVILIRKITDDLVWDDLYKLTEYDPTNLTAPNNIATYELGTDTDFEDAPCDNNGYTIGGWPINNVQVYHNDDVGVHGIIGDNVFAPNDPLQPFNFRSWGVAILAVENSTGEEKCIYIDANRFYSTVYKQDVNIKFETVAGIEENFILSFTNTPQYE